MVNVQILQIFRDNKGNIVKYNIQDETGSIKLVPSKELKQNIRLNKINVTGYRLTSNNRLIKVKDRNIIDINNDTHKYVMMNKDNTVAVIEHNLDNYRLIGKLPIGLQDMRQWITDRAKFSCARNITEFFKTIGINTVHDLIEITHCVSLSDTFWIKRQDNNINWASVSPFKNSYSKVISEYALEGLITNKDKNYFSPVISTDGTFPHTWDFNGGDILFIKASSKFTLGGSNSGREPFSEYYASVIGKYLQFSCVDYRIRKHLRRDNKIDVVTVCKCYTSENTGSISASKLGLDSYEKIIDFCKLLGEQSFKTIIDMLFLDCLLLNTDRHYSNIEFMVNNDTLQVLEIAPIFDNNYALLPRFIEGYDKFDRSEYTARDSRTFEEIYRVLKSYRSFNKELISLKKLKLTAPENVDIQPKRLSFLNWLLQTQVNYLLSLR